MADDTTHAYAYSGVDMVIEAWHEAVLPLKKLAEETAGVAFNSCLLNWYRDGQDSMGWHADDERVYGPEPVICSVSLGCPRDFQLREKADHSNKLSYALGQGDVLVMRGSLQSYWQHQVPKRARVAQPRINLTFRCVKFPMAKGHSKAPSGSSSKAA